MPKKLYTSFSLSNCTTGDRSVITDLCIQHAQTATIFSGVLHKDKKLSEILLTLVYPCGILYLYHRGIQEMKGEMKNEKNI